MRQAFDVAYHYALTNKRGGAVPIILTTDDPVARAALFAWWTNATR